MMRFVALSLAALGGAEAAGLHRAGGTPPVLRVAALQTAATNKAAVQTNSTNKAALKQPVTTKRLRADGGRTLLRLCNVYPLPTSMEVYLGDEQLTTSPMAYKTCESFEPNLGVGSKLDFSFGGEKAGSFVVTAVPEHDAVLLLAVFRTSDENADVAFESHVFSDLQNAQLAVMNTYRGPGQSTLRIEDSQADGRQEVLQFNSVVAINGGSYDVSLVRQDGTLEGKLPLDARGGSSYVAIRCGAELRSGKAYPEDLIVTAATPTAAMGERAKSGAERSARALGASLLAATLLHGLVSAL